MAKTPEEQPQKCGTCVFFDDGTGVCRRYPPTVSVVALPALQVVEWSTDWPYVEGYQLCGEWKARP